MERNTNSFKAIINNIAKKDKIAAQAVLQTYMLERLLERISISKYRDNFILKGGLLISAMLGIDSRTTMDMDTTIKGFNLDEENITCILKEICELDIKDNVILNLKKVEKIREKDEYGVQLTSSSLESLKGKFNAVILAVAHKEFVSLDIRSFLKNENGVVYDVKGILDREMIDGRL